MLPAAPGEPLRTAESLQRRLCRLVCMIFSIFVAAALVAGSELVESRRRRWSAGGGHGESSTAERWRRAKINKMLTYATGALVRY